MNGASASAMPRFGSFLSNLVRRHDDADVPFGNIARIRPPPAPLLLRLSLCLVFSNLLPCFQVQTFIPVYIAAKIRPISLV